ncbi:ubiquinone biosynthesis protein COQ4 [Globomyces pollinis-pini]|nr:ubiquinone biosynthesis protein COQ4 [Globomyces pollinis-pini]
MPVTPSLLCRSVIALQSALIAFNNPLRGDMVAALGETTGLSAIHQMRRKMRLDTAGRKILRIKPIINSSTIDYSALAALPKNTFGYHYQKFMQDHNITSDSRSDVKYIGDPELAYVMLRYRQIHDFWHTLVDLPIATEAEIALKYFEFFQTGLPMNALSALVGPLRLSPSERERLMNVYIPWAIQCGQSSKFLMNVMYEDLFEMDIEKVRNDLGIIPAPILIEEKELEDPELSNTI